MQRGSILGYHPGMLKTERGYGDPRLCQLSVYLQNRIGQLGDLLRHLEDERLAVHAFSIADSIDFAVVRLIVDRPKHAHEVLSSAGFTVTETRVLAVELPLEGGLLTVCRVLLGGEINIHYAYPMLSRPCGRPVVLVRVDDFETAHQVLVKREFRMLDENDLKDGEPSP